MNHARRNLHVMMLISFAALAWPTLLAAAEPPGRGPRDWTDVTGKHTVKATFLAISDGKVELRKDNGSVIKVPLAKFREADRVLAKTLEKARLVARPAEKDGNPFAEAQPAAADDKPLTVQEVTEKVGKGIVLVSTRDHLGEKQKLGTGFVIDPSGLIATNYHVIKDASVASVRFRDGTEMGVVGYGVLDKRHDLAILQLKDPPRTLTALTIQVPEALKQGDTVIAIGHPVGFEFTVSNGIVSAIRKTKEMPEQIQAFLNSEPDCRWLQINALSAPGSSGGPLLSTRGDVMGVVTWVVSVSGQPCRNDHAIQRRRRAEDAS